MKTKILTAILSLCLCFSFAMFLSSAVATKVKADDETVLFNKTKIGYSVSFSSLSSYSDKWQDNAFAYSFVTVAPSSNKYLGVGKQNVSAEGSGYVIYLVSSENGKAIQNLGLKMNARVFHLSDHDGCDCHMSVLVSEDGNSYSLVKRISVGFDGGLQTYDFPLEQGSGKTELFVKIEMTGKEWDWVGIDALEFYGAYTVGKDEIVWNYESPADSLILSDVGKKHTFIKATAESSQQKYDYEITVVDPDGETSDITADGFIPYSLGEYTVMYSVKQDGNVISSSSYSIFVVKKKDADGYDDKNLTSSVNYYGDGAVLTESDNGLKISGKALYVLPLNFEKTLKTVFSFDSVSEGGKARIAILSKPVIADYEKKNVDGLYFTFYNTAGGMKFNGFFVGGGRFTELGNQPDGFYSASIGKHALEIRKSTAADYANGAEMFVDGVRFSDWLGYSAVNMKKVAPDGKVYISVETESVSQIKLVKAVNEDSSFPIIKPIDQNAVMPRSGEVGERIVIPEYTSIDDVDGERPVTVTVTDPYGNKVALNEDNSFIAEFEGMYSVILTACDLSGNVAERKSSITVAPKAGMCAFKFTTPVEQNARIGKKYEISVPSVTNLGAGKSLEIKVTDPDGENILIENNSFVPEKIGDYTLEYLAENDLGVSRKIYTVHSKLNVDEKLSYENFKNSEYWVSDSNGFSVEDDGVKIWDRSYLKLPFDMKNGVEITLGIDVLKNKLEQDCWFSVGITNFADYGSYAYQNRYGVYFMLYREGDTYKYNVLSYGGAGVTQTIVSSAEIGSVSSTDVIKIRVEKFTGDASFDDNIVIYVNDKKNENFSVFNVALSDICDNESFSYLCFASYHANSSVKPESETLFTLNKIAFSDYEAPKIATDGTLPKTVKKGEKVIIPSFTVTDNVDLTPFSKIRLYAPDGKVMDISSGSFVAETEGRYTLVIKANDQSGNSVILIYNIQCGDVKPVESYVYKYSGGTKVIGCGGSVAAIWWLIPALAASAIVLKRKGRNE